MLRVSYDLQPFLKFCQSECITASAAYEHARASNPNKKCGLSVLQTLGKKRCFDVIFSSQPVLCVQRAHQIAHVYADLSIGFAPLHTCLSPVVARVLYNLQLLLDFCEPALKTPHLVFLLSQALAGVLCTIMPATDLQNFQISMHLQSGPLLLVHLVPRQSAERAN